MIIKRVVLGGLILFLVLLTNTRLSLVFAFSSRLEIMEEVLTNLEHSQELGEITSQRPAQKHRVVADAKEKEYWIFTLGSEQLYVGLGLGLKSGYINGDTTYHISFAGGESELEFPLDNVLWGITASFAYKGKKDQEIEIKQHKDKAMLSVEWITNIDKDAGKMKDSDWTDGDGHPGLDIYSESDADLRINMVDTNFICNFWPRENISIGPIVGYRYQKFEYDISNTDQVGYGPYHPAYTGFTSGKTLDYEVEYKIPYLGIISDLLLGDKFQLSLKFGYAPWVDAKDRDDHILRYKLSIGDCKGDAYFLDLNAAWVVLPNWLLQIEGKYMDIDTKGTQHQKFYAGSSQGVTADVNDKITSSLSIVSAKLKYSF